MNDMELAEELDQLRNQLVMNRGLHTDDHQNFCTRLGEIIAALRRGHECPVTAYSHLTQEQFDQLQNDAMSWRTRPPSGEMVMVPRGFAHVLACRLETDAIIGDERSHARKLRAMLSACEEKK